MKKLILYHFSFLLLFFSSSISLFAQDVNTLLHEIESSQHDTTKLRLYVAITDVCDIPEIKTYTDKALALTKKLEDNAQLDQQIIRFYKGNTLINLGFYYHHVSDYDNAIIEYDNAYSAFESIPDSSGMALALSNVAMVYENKGQSKKAIKLLNKVIQFTKNSNDPVNMNAAYTNLSSIYGHQGIYSKAVEYALKGLKIQEETNSLEGMGYSLNNIGTFYFKQKDFDNAKKYLLKSIKIREEINDELGASNTYLNLAIISEDEGKNDVALEYIQKSIAITKKLEVDEYLASAYIKLGSHYEFQSILDSALFYYNKAHEINMKTQTIEGKSDSYRHIAKIYLLQKKYVLAERYGEKGLKLAQKIGYPEDIQPSAIILSNLYEKTKNYKRAFNMYKLYIEMRDSTTNEKNQRSIIQQNLNYKYEKQKMADSLAFAVEKEVNDLKSKTELDKKNTRIIALGIGVLMLLIIAVITLFAYRNKQKANEIIVLQKQKVEEQKLEVEDKNQEITDSIAYAKRIQDAILPSDILVQKLLPNSFIYYKPKDIVAGDFYWIEEKEQLVIFAAADCTGHGVPGALVSVVCHNALNRAVREFNLSDPALILDKVTEIVIETFEQSNTIIKDGMDIALCTLNTTTNELVYAGANNPLYIIRNKELLETKANKQPVGKHFKQDPFTSHKIQLQKKDAIYLFSDGYPDQFGGPKGKKFMYKPFKSLLISLFDKEMKKQSAILNSTFNNWKGDLDQIDDVCIIGVKV